MRVFGILTKLGTNQDVQFQPFIFSIRLIDRKSCVDPSRSWNPYSPAKSDTRRVFPDFDILLGSMARLDTAIPANSVDSPSSNPVSAS